jgi:integrase
MDKQQVQTSLEMLRQVLDGRSYADIGRDMGLSRSGVGKRVKAMEREIRRTVGVGRLPRRGPITTAEMRRLREHYRVAMGKYLPAGEERSPVSLGALTDTEIEHVAELTRERSACALRDVALLYMLFSTGAKPLEIARLRVADYVDEAGSVRSDSLISEEVAVTRRARPLFFVAPELTRAIDAYLKYRVQRGQGATAENTYRGLDPHSRLFLTEDGREMAVKIRSGQRQRLCCSLILDIYRKCFERAGLKGVSTLTARRTVAERMRGSGYDLRSIGDALGIKNRDTVRRLIPKTRGSLREEMRELVLAEGGKLTWMGTHTS